MPKRRSRRKSRKVNRKSRNKSRMKKSKRRMKKSKRRMKKSKIKSRKKSRRKSRRKSRMQQLQDRVTSPSRYPHDLNQPTCKRIEKQVARLDKLITEKSIDRIEEIHHLVEIIRKEGERIREIVSNKSNEVVATIDSHHPDP